VKRYLVNEMFRSLQGEGANAGTVMTFVRFAKCNLACTKEVEGFDCDTDFAHGTWFTVDELVGAVKACGPCGWVLFTGGEPSLQLDAGLVAAVHHEGYNAAIETNGTRPVDRLGLDWVCCSPKPGSTQVVLEADEFKFVIPPGGQLPVVTGKSRRLLLSPAADGDTVIPEALATCISLVLDNPQFCLSVQQHKAWGVR
jgi:7-carboxy-7-deazaguanine synthase